MTILVTGGAGYIGSHTTLLLLEAGYQVAVVDNLCNSSEESLRRVEVLTGKRVRFHRADLLDREALEGVFAAEQPSAVLHLAGLKAVGESVGQPLRYFHNNVTGTLVLCEVMQARGVKTLVFCSSATVYGDPQSVPITEDFPLSATNPYGRSKLMIEEILRDLAVADPEWRIGILRYFNRAGVWADCIRQRKAVFHNNYAALPDRKGLPQGHAPIIRDMAVPVLRDGKIVAVLGMGNKSEEYTSEDVELVSTLADFTWDIIKHKQADEAQRESEEKFPHPGRLDL